MDLNSFGFRRKKKRRFPALEALKVVSLISGTALSVNRALKEKIKKQQYLLQRQKKQESEDVSTIVAGLIGGLLAGSILALFFAPESGEKLRERINNFFLTENGHNIQDTLEEARKKAQENTGTNGGS